MATEPITPSRPKAPQGPGPFLHTYLPLSLALVTGGGLLGATVYLVVHYFRVRDTDRPFILRRLVEPFNLPGFGEITSELGLAVFWLSIVTVVLLAGFVYIVVQYVRDGRAIGWAWASFLALLRGGVYAVLAFVFLGPATQNVEFSRLLSKVLLVFDVTPSLTEGRDDPPAEGIPYEKMPTRQDKVLQFLAANQGAFLGRLQEKNDATTYRFGRQLDENFHQFTREDDGGWHWTRLEWERRSQPEGRDEQGRLLEPEVKEWTEAHWREWLVPKLQMSIPDNVDPQERARLVAELEKSQQMFQTTNLGDPLLTLLNREGNNMLQGIVVFSDGRSTEGSPAALRELIERAHKNKIPIFVVAVGDDRPKVKIEITDVRVPKQPRPEDKFPVVVEIAGHGMDGKECPLVLEVSRVVVKEGKEQEVPIVLVETNAKGDPTGKEIALEKVLLRPPSTPKYEPGTIPLARAEFQIDAMALAKAAGQAPADGTKLVFKEDDKFSELRFVVRVPKDKNEVFALKEHVSTPAPVKVAKKPLRVLLVASGPSREYQFVRTLFVREKERVELCIYLQPPPGRTEPRQGVVNDVPPERLLKTFPDRFEDEGKKTEEKYYNLASYDLLVGFDPDWSLLSEAQMNLVKQWVDKGGGLIVVGGPINTLQLAKPGSYKDKIRPILDLYPVVLEDSRQQELERPTADPWRLNFPGVLDNMEFMRLEDGDTGGTFLRPWEEFFYGKDSVAPKDDGRKPAVDKAGNPQRGFYNYYPVKHAKDAAQVIATFTDPRARLGDGKEQPFLVVMPYGGGKVFWIGAGEMWRLRGYRESYHERFWTKLARYVGGGSLTAGHRRIKPLVGRTFAANTYVPIEAQILNRDMKPLDEKARPKLVVTPPKGSPEKEQTLEMTKKTSAAQEWGGYFTARVLLKAAGDYQYRIEVAETGDADEGTFTIKEANPELDNTRPDFETLWELASDADEFLARVPDEKKRREIRQALVRPKLAPSPEPEKAEAKELKPAAADDKPRLYFDLRTAHLIPDCMVTDRREQRIPGRVEDWWDEGFPPGARENKWISWVLLLVVTLLSAEWLTRKLLRLA